MYFTLVAIPHTTEPDMFLVSVIHPNGDTGSVYKLSQRELEQWQLELTAAVVNAGMNELWDGSLNQTLGESPNV